MPVKYVPYYPETIEGQAILNNITRTQRVLRYRENDKVYERIKRGMPYYEVETIETVGDPSDNLVIRGECISACAYLKEKGIKVDLVYIDPPFASGINYSKKVYLRKNHKVAEKLNEVENEIQNTIIELEIAEEETGYDMAVEIQMELDKLRTFEETMYGDFWKKEDYLNWIYENLIAIKSIMSDEASIYVHIDYHIGHYVKILMDEIFGDGNFINEIIWKRKGGSSNPDGQFDVATDTLFMYSKSEKYVFNRQYVLDSNDVQKYISERFINIEGDRKYMTSPIVSPNYRENLIYEYKGYQAPPNGWSIEIEVMKKWDIDGKLYFPKKGKRIYRKIFLDEYEGQPAQNLWNDIFVINPMAVERVGYSTQKPEALLQRVIKTSTNEGMLIADFFGGSGVTAKVSNNSNRKFIHCDIGINSIQTARDGLKEKKANFQVLEIKDGVSLFRNPQQTMDKLKMIIPGLQTQVSGVSKFWFGAVTESKYGTVPVYVPNLLNTQEKVLDIPAINTIINQEIQSLEIDVKKVIVYYIDVDDIRQIEKFIRDNNITETEVELRDLKNLLHEVVIEDKVDYQIAQKENIYETGITAFTSDRLIQKINEFNQKGNLQSLNNGRKFSPISISEEGLELIELVALDCQNESGKWHSTTEIKIDKLGYVIKDGVKSKSFWDGKIMSKIKPRRLKIRNISGDETIIPIL